MIIELGKVSVKTQGCTQFQVEIDSAGNKWRTYTDGLGHFAGTKVNASYFLVPACA
jgi:hypothetical protein